MNIKRALYHVFVGALVGGGAILPGVSGGVLCLIFGIYEPLMETLSHPKTALKKYIGLFVPFLVGYAVGFWGLAGVIGWIFEKNELLATWLFIGLITGMLPSLYKDSGKDGRGWGCWLAFLLGFGVLFGILLVVRLGILPTIEPGFGAFVFCGVLWGLSFVVPGMTSSSQLMALGLFEPLTNGIAALDMGVVIPWAIGMVATVLLCARLVSHLFRTHRGIMYHIVLGVAVASTVIIVPLEYAGAGQVLLSLLCGAVGFVVAMLMEKLEKKEE